MEETQTSSSEKERIREIISKIGRVTIMMIEVVRRNNLRTPKIVACKK